MFHLWQNFLAVVEEGSLNRAAARLHVSQSALSRQVRTLENEVGAALLERQPGGVKPTALGQAAISGLGRLVGQFDGVLADLRRQARGQRAELRIGYLGSAASRFLNAAVAALRKLHPEAKVKLFDLTPGEQIAALQAGGIDLALIGQEGAPLAREFHTRRLATLGVRVVMALDHPLASRRELSVGDLRGQPFIGAPDREVPGRNQWITRLCRKAGFRPRFLAEGDSIGEVFSLIASEGAVTLLPDYFNQPPPGTRFVPLADLAARWELLLLWQRGRAPVVLLAMVDLLGELARRAGNNS